MSLHTPEVWKRAVLEFIILVLLAIIYMGWADYHTMVENNKLMKHNFIDDVVGYNYCDKGD